MAYDFIFRSNNDPHVHPSIRAREKKLRELEQQLDATIRKNAYITNAAIVKIMLGLKLSVECIAKVSYLSVPEILELQKEYLASLEESAD
jgi:hypothetical protein